MSKNGYPSDLTDAQWERLAPLPAQRAPAPAKSGGRPRSVDVRAIIDPIFYRTKTGCQWRQLPRDFPPWGTVAGYYRNWRRTGVWEAMHDSLREAVRVKAGREPTPSAAIIDSQSVKTTEGGSARLRRAQEGDRAQAAHRRGHDRLAAGGRRPCGERAGPG